MISSSFKNTREFLEYCKPHIKGKVLDLGAGTAKYRDIIKNTAVSYVAFDKFPGPNIDVVGDIHETGLTSGSFNTIICTQVLEHVPVPWLAAKEIKRLLDNDGICIVTTPFMQASHADPHDFYRFTTDGIAQIFLMEGFEIVEKGAYGKTWSVLFDLIKLLRFNPYHRPRRGTWTLVQWSMRVADFLDRFTTNEIIYGSSYAIVKKVS
jgi:SAM-dependent methyltransferase